MPVQPTGSQPPSQQRSPSSSTQSSSSSIVRGGKGKALVQQSITKYFTQMGKKTAPSNNASTSYNASTRAPKAGVAKSTSTRPTARAPHSHKAPAASTTTATTSAASGGAKLFMPKKSTGGRKYF